MQGSKLAAAIKFDLYNYKLPMHLNFTYCKKIGLIILLLPVFMQGFARQKGQTENIVIVTIDGCRWQDVFRGPDSSMLFGEKFMKDNAVRLRKPYWDTNTQVHRQKLMPFIWGIMNNTGQLYGNRDNDSRVSVSNPYNLSYPGYSEIFTGRVDTVIN